MSVLSVVHAGHPCLSAAPVASVGTGPCCVQDPGFWGWKSGDRGLDLGRAQRAARKGEGKACFLQNLDAPTKLWHAERRAWRTGTLRAWYLWLLSAGALQPWGGRAAPPPAHRPREGPGACLPARCHTLSAGPGTRWDSRGWQ